MSIKLLLLGNLLLTLVVSGYTWQRLHSTDPSQRRLLGMLVMTAGLLIPLLGAPGFAWAMLYGTGRAAADGTIAYRPLSTAHFDGHGGGEEGSQFDRGGLRARVTKREVPREKRMQSLAALQHLPTSASTSVLRTLLDDDVEDIRLVAFGMLDKEEKAITEQIHRLLNQPQATTSTAYLQRNKRLAELYWELAYSGLVQGELRRYALEHALNHVQLALKEDDREAGLWFLCARVLNALGRTDEAETHFHTAEKLGIPESRILPYLAEFAFRCGDYARTRQQLAALADTPVTPRLRPVVEFWQGGDKV